MNEMIEKLIYLDGFIGGVQKDPKAIYRVQDLVIEMIESFKQKEKIEQLEEKKRMGEVMSYG